MAAAGRAGHAVHIKLVPRTRNMRESRQVLSFLKSYGDVLSFRNMKYDQRDAISPHLIHVVFRDAGAARRLIADSPMRFEIAPPPPDRPALSPANYKLAETLNAVQESINNSNGTGVRQQEAARDFTLTANHYVNFNHLQYIQRQSHYWEYSNTPRTFPQVELAKTVPVEGMADVSVSPSQLPLRSLRNRLAATEQAINADRSLR